MSRVCAWILLLIFRLRVVLRGCASKFRSHGRRRVDFSLEVGRRCPCEAVRRNFGLTAGVASISPWKSGGVVLARPCVKVSRSRRSQIGPEERGDVVQDKEPSLKQVAPREVPETGTTRMCETVLAEVAQRSPTSPETNLESRAMQDRVPWTQAWLCTKDFHGKCTGAGVAAKSRFPAMQPSEVKQGLTSTKLGLKSHWTVGVTWTESLDSRDLARRAERRPKGPVMQLFGACGCRGKIPSTHGRFLRSFWCREEAGYPHSMHKQENSREGGRISVTELQ
ncbi:hypothetical protein NDU88_002039 [Pleurodeles waltl]|uniref:Secreted protein n=1 Tax=Pleurodeles waltl TaxID=8319 RepID=A0AAV7VD70_PLEWA|nr:hypothetical protein NDU88_002039 [Pleurodeles waltl]